MKVVILAGGKGTRISEESKIRPKPMIQIGGEPIICHIMDYYEKYNCQDFIVCCGYKGEVIKKYFIHYYMNSTDTDIDIGAETCRIPPIELRKPWKITLVNTGLDTLTSGRLKQVKKYVDSDTFMLTYGDGVSDVDLKALLEFHKRHGKVATITTTRPEGRFGAIRLAENTDMIQGFREKAREDQSWVNIGFMVFEPSIFNYLGKGNSMLETEPFEKLVEEGQLMAYRHEGFWSPMDNMHDKEYLEELIKQGRAPWK